MAPVRIRWTATAVWARSPRCLGNSTPRLTSPTWWPARPTRWRALATLGGDSIWTTRSTAPMSMPSSRLLVATTAGSRPRLRSSSISARCSLETEPWWALAITVSAPVLAPDWAMISAGLLCGSARSPVARSVAISLSRAVSRSESRRLLAKTIVLLCCSIRSTTCSSTCGQIDCARVGSSPSPRRRPPAGSCPRRVRRPGGPTPWCSAAPRSRRARLPPRNRATSSSGRTVALSPIRWAGRSSSASSRSRRDREVGAALGAGHRVHLVDDHRLDAAQALASLAGEHQEQRLGRGDQDVRRLGSRACGGRPPGCRRCARPTVTSGTADAEPLGGVPDPGQRAAQVALDVDGQRLERADVEHPGALACGPPAGRC